MWKSWNNDAPTHSPIRVLVSGDNNPLDTAEADAGLVRTMAVYVEQHEIWQVIGWGSETGEIAEATGAVIEFWQPYDDTTPTIFLLHYATALIVDITAAPDASDRYQIRHEHAIVWRGATYADATEWAAANDIKLETVEFLEPVPVKPGTPAPAAEPSE